MVDVVPKKLQEDQVEEKEHNELGFVLFCFFKGSKA